MNGMEAGQEKNFPVNVPPKFYLKELANKEIDCKIKLESVQKIELPEVSDEFARGIGKFKDLQDLRKSIKEGILIEKRQQESQRVRQEILGEISKEVNIEIPGVLLEKEKEKALESLKTRVSQDLGMKFEDYLKKTKKTEGDISSSLLPKVMGQVKNFLILKEIQKQENISVSEEEITKEANRTISKMPDKETADKSVDPRSLREYTKEMLLLEKTFAQIESYSQ
jgi:trigger factor